MGPFSALDSVMSNYFTLKGRAPRSEFWWYSLMYGILLFAALFFDLFLFDPSVPVSLNPLSYFTTFWVLANIIPTFTVTIRRLHDTGRSGWWYLTFMLPVVGPGIYLFLMVLPSEQRENLFGPPPFGLRGSNYSGHDIHSVALVEKPKAPHNPYAGYALLDRANRPASAETLQARKDEISDYYRARVLRQT